MGRKALERARKPLTKKAKAWVREMVPLLQDQQLDKLTLDELAALVGKSKSTIYSYFSTKEEIYETAVRLLLKDLEFITTPEAIEGENIESVLESILLTIGAALQGISISFLEQIQQHFPDVWDIIEYFTDQVLANFERIYQRGMQEGAFQNFSLPLLLAMDRHFVMSIMTDAQQFEQEGMSLNDLIQEYIELRLNALRVV